jgi:hypothetical protein
MTGVGMATMVLVLLAVDGWRVSGATCPYPSCTNGSPSCLHALSCTRHHLRGHNATHTTMKRCTQRLLRGHHVDRIGNEDKSMFSQQQFSADTAVYPGGMAFGVDSAGGQNQGFIVDNTVRMPAADKYLRPVRANAATEDGYAARQAEVEKLAKHRGSFAESRWTFVPFVQESFGRLGEQASLFVRRLAMHSATCRGGTRQEILRRRAFNVRQIRLELSAALSRELGERVMSYVRGAVMLGREARPVSALLSHAGY